VAIILACISSNVHADVKWHFVLSIINSAEVKQCEEAQRRGFETQPPD
jgi:hypothetical protein